MLWAVIDRNRLTRLRGRYDGELEFISGFECTFGNIIPLIIGFRCVYTTERG